MRYYYLKFPKKLREARTQVEYWTSGRNAVNEMSVAVYFGKISTSDTRESIKKEKAGQLTRRENIEELKKKGGGRNYSDLKSFFEGCESEQRDNTRFLVSSEDKRTMLVLKPTSEVRDLEPTQLREYRNEFPKRDGGQPKYAYCELVRSIDRSNAPSIIATLGSDQALNRGTCNELDQAQSEALEAYLSEGKMTLTDGDPCKLLQYLTPVQFETLVFLNFHERNFHCTAHRGSTTEGFDFIVEKNAGSPHDFLPFESERITLEVKHKHIKKPTRADFTVALSTSTRSPKILDGKWLLKKTAKQERCFAWLRKELEWTRLSEEEWNRIREAAILHD